MRDSLAEQLTEQLRRAIISGELQPGTRLTEKALGERFGVSRVPIRESLRTLTADGFVESRAYAGSTVSRPPADEAEDLFAVRIVLESTTARRAAERAARQSANGAPEVGWFDIRKQLAEVLQAGDTAIAEHDYRRLAELNMRFHLLIAELSGRETLTALLRQISGKLEWLYALTVEHRGISSWEEHRPILAMIDAGQAGEAGAALGEHVQRSRDSYLTLVAQGSAMDHE
ncbi:GntR family transcriptional regulator [Brevibacterium sp. 50QC2O2]|uniref:GntR family transcriptional regulator n=1 Tax=Brevibacterium TaxID=1696 RepID=UPI00211B8617|nr:MULTISPECIES: GntR family transcriptional regulator [unclassified Brevibacterium]MCQ9368877.1 GntR family transcriptional regulator [Brevibacterium sp. 91QC2O2]MCQ9386624.1 GntR family transcriptional regulator [Brevibacterium sp. 68QC2CO]MCQ9388457.1 GntR family transcriptional regulator [Brevibacterium sp. 50QC2O2]